MSDNDLLPAIRLMHAWTKEIVTLPVENVTALWVTVRWGMSGLYNLYLWNNELMSQSVAARRHSGKPLWSCPDIEAVRKAVISHVQAQKKRADTNLAMIQHARTMPLARTPSPITVEVDPSILGLKGEAS